MDTIEGPPDEPGWYFIWNDIFQSWECIEVYMSVSGLRIRSRSGAEPKKVEELDCIWSEKIETPEVPEP